MDLNELEERSASQLHGGGILRECGVDGGLYLGFRDGLRMKAQTADDIRLLQATYMRDNRTVKIPELGDISLANWISIKFDMTVDEYANHVVRGKDGKVHEGNEFDCYVLSRQGQSRAYHAPATHTYARTY